MKLNALEYHLMNNPFRAILQEVYEIKAFTDRRYRKKWGKVLELGCGNGHGAELIDKHFHPQSIIGVDLDEKMINEAKNKQTDRVKFEVGDATHLPFQTGAFDGVFDFGIIHHIPNWQKCLDESYRVLRPNGYIFIEDLSIETFIQPLGKIFRRVLNHPYESMYTTKQFFDYFEKVGFTILKQEIRRPFGLLSYFVLIGKKCDA